MVRLGAFKNFKQRTNGMEKDRHRATVERKWWRGGQSQRSNDRLWNVKIWAVNNKNQTWQ